GRAPRTRTPRLSVARGAGRGAGAAAAAFPPLLRISRPASTASFPPAATAPFVPEAFQSPRGAACASADRGVSPMNTRAGMMQRVMTVARERQRRPLPPTPSPKRRGGERQALLPLSASGRGLGGGVVSHRVAAPHSRSHRMSLVPRQGKGERSMAFVPKILAFAGSLRQDSYNKKLVQLAVTAARNAGAEVTYLDLRDL